MRPLIRLPVPLRNGLLDVVDRRVPPMCRHDSETVATSRGADQVTRALWRHSGLGWPQV
jgi:hypothetical protein